MGDKLLLSCAALFLERGFTIAFAESATAGRACSAFASVKNAGKFLKGGLVCYNAEVKEKLLKVPPGMISTFTPESLEVTKAITIGLETLISADFHVGITGLTASGGSESIKKPVGTMFIHVRHLTMPIISEQCLFHGNQEAIILQTIRQVSKSLCRYLRQHCEANPPRICQ